MADDPVPRAPVRRIKIKFGNKLVSTHAVRVPGLVSSASQDSKDTKSGSALHLARLRQASLQGYVPPSATADAIVARLREGEGFAPGSELPPWDFTAPPVVSCQERPAKRSRPLACAEDRCQQPCPGPAVDVAAGAPRREGPVGPGRSEAAHGGTFDQTVKAESIAARAAATATGSGESNSDQATNSQVYLPLSPDDAGDVGARRTGTAAVVQPRASIVVQSSLATTGQQQPDTLPPQRQRPSASANAAAAAAAPASAAPKASLAQAKEPSAPPTTRGLAAPPSCTAASARCGAGGSCSPTRPGSVLTARGDVPSTSGRKLPTSAPSAALAAARAAAASPNPSGVSVETQTSQRDFPVLPVSFLELSRLSGTALSFQSIGPFDLQLNGGVVIEGRIDAHIDAARKAKREGDQMFQQNKKQWEVKSLSKYIMASLMFMEAADAMLQHPRREQRQAPRNAADLYRQTADLLCHTVTFTDTIKGNGIGKEALRLLAERLCSVCLLRQTSLMAGSFKACAEKAQAALREHQRQQSAQGAGAGATASALGSGQQPSPEDSSTSSLHAAVLPAGSGGGQAVTGGGAQPLAGFGHDQVSELLGYARTSLRFSEFMKRSTKSFEAFLERSDVRTDQQAKLVCMHLAAVCMDVGMTPNLRVIHHAREAVRTLVEDLAPPAAPLPAQPNAAGPQAGSASFAPRRPART